MSDDCYYCSVKQARIEYLESEIRRLQRKIRKLQEVIDQLRRMFKMIKDFCLKVMNTMHKQYLSKKSGVERGRWAWAKGMFTVSKAIAKVAAKAEWLAEFHLN